MEASRETVARYLSQLLEAERSASARWLEAKEHGFPPYYVARAMRVDAAVLELQAKHLRALANVVKAGGEEEYAAAMDLYREERGAR